MERDELEAAEKYFCCVPARTEIENNDPDVLVVGRYSVLPFYRELERDVRNLGGRMINSATQHEYIADLRNWTTDLEGLTPQTWYRMEDVPRDAGPFVLKGLTNSRKDRWKTHMFAETWEDMGTVYSRLTDDQLISHQGIAIRKYVPLERYMTSEINGMPITKEFRFFVAYGQILCGAYYWSSHVEELRERGIDPQVSEVPEPFLAKVISTIGDAANFYALDVAQTTEGVWVVIELNDGQMSGLSENNPDTLYRRLREVIGNGVRSVR
jgi:hypothetical protein